MTPQPNLPLAPHHLPHPRDLPRVGKNGVEKCARRRGRPRSHAKEVLAVVGHSPRSSRQIHGFTPPVRSFFFEVPFYVAKEISNSLLPICFIRSRIPSAGGYPCTRFSTAGRNNRSSPS